MVLIDLKAFLVLSISVKFYNYVLYQNYSKVGYVNVYLFDNKKCTIKQTRFGYILYLFI